MKIDIGSNELKCVLKHRYSKYLFEPKLRNFAVCVCVFGYDNANSEISNEI